jgi:hypothetical protein
MEEIFSAPNPSLDLERLVQEVHRNRTGRKGRMAAPSAPGSQVETASLSVVVDVGAACCAPEASMFGCLERSNWPAFASRLDERRSGR